MIHILQGCARMGIDVCNVDSTVLSIQIVRGTSLYHMQFARTFIGEKRHDKC